MPRYRLPQCLQGKCKQEKYTRWLDRKAAAHVKRDKKRKNTTASGKLYRDAIHKAVCNGGDRDAYTGKPLAWRLIGRYNNEDSKREGWKYKKKFAHLPTVDHEGHGKGEPKFRICAWRTNDCKSDLSVRELAEFCKQFLAYQKRRTTNRQ
jgi:hypothetical protein